MKNHQHLISFKNIIFYLFLTITLNCISQNKIYNLKPLKGLKLVTLGNSITEGVKWQPKLVELTGMIWSKTETISGSGGFSKMGLGNSKVVPLTGFWQVGLNENLKNGLAFDHDNNPIYETDGITQKFWFLGRAPMNSIYERAGDVVNYSPEVVFILAGQNDGLQTTWDISDEPYTGGWLLPDETPPSYVSAYKGMLEKTLKKSPYAKIYIGCMMLSGDPLTESQKANYLLNAELHKQLADMYGCEFINMLEVGFNEYNSSYYYIGGHIHPAKDGGDIMGTFLSRKMR